MYPTEQGDREKKAVVVQSWRRGICARWRRQGRVRGEVDMEAWEVLQVGELADKGNGNVLHVTFK